MPSGRSMLQRTAGAKRWKGDREAKGTPGGFAARLEQRKTGRRHESGRGW